MKWKRQTHDTFGRELPETWVAYDGKDLVARVTRNTRPGCQWWMYWTDGTSGSTKADENDHDSRKTTLIDAISCVTVAYMRKNLLG